MDREGFLLSMLLSPHPISELAAEKTIAMLLMSQFF